MCKRFVSIWFPYLKTDWFTRQHQEFKKKAFVLTTPDHGRILVSALNEEAFRQGVSRGMVLADARAIIPGIKVIDDNPLLSEKLLSRLAEYCIRFTPVVATDLPDGLMLDATGCAHLWGGEKEYIDFIHQKFQNLGYHTRISMADTIAAAWAFARFSNENVIETGKHSLLILNLPPASLRIDLEIIERLHKLGMRRIADFISMGNDSLRRRFGQMLVQRLRLVLGQEEDFIQPFQPVSLYLERLPCLEPIRTRTGIEIALETLLEMILNRIIHEGKGIRHLIFKSYRIDGRVEQVEIGTNRPTQNKKHILKLFEEKLSLVEPALGIELFTLEATKVEDVRPLQVNIWKENSGFENQELAELLDRFAGKFGANSIHRYLPDEHYWPERSVKLAVSIVEEKTSPWKMDRPRPLQLLQYPERIEVAAPIPDYPPMHFRHKGELHKIVKADGPERIEQEWWLQQGEHRDYYYVEDEKGSRYWLFRLGHYTGDKSNQWYLHGYFG